jgi:methanogenic corrinoid protein MtbC1
VTVVPPGAPGTQATSDELQHFVELLARQDRREAIRSAVRLMTDGMSVADFILGILGPALARLSQRMWERGQWTVAYQQTATEIADTLLAVAAANARPGSADGRLVVCVAERDSQNLPARMLCELLRAQGFKVTFLGTPTMTSGVVRMLQHMEADALLVSCAVPINLPGTLPLLAAAHEIDVPVLAAGRGFGSDDLRATCLGADAWAPALDAIEAAVDRFRGGHRSLRHCTAEVAQSQEIAAIRPLLTEELAESFEYRSGHLLPRGPRSQRALRTDMEQLLRWLEVAVLCDERILPEYVEGLTHRAQHRQQDVRVIPTMLRSIEDRLAFDVPAVIAPLGAAQTVARLAA